MAASLVCSEEESVDPRSSLRWVFQSCEELDELLPGPDSSSLLCDYLVNGRHYFGPAETHPGPKLQVSCLLAPPERSLGTSSIESVSIVALA